MSKQNKQEQIRNGVIIIRNLILRKEQKAVHTYDKDFISELEEILSTIISQTRQEAVEEKIICSAIKTPKNVIIKGHRHNDCFRTAKGISTISEHDIKFSQQGFINSKNEFVTREEAHKIYYGVEGKLFSEDLY